MKELIVEEKYNNKKLNNYILEKFPNLSQNTLYKALRKKDIRVNEKRVSENVTIYNGDIIKVFICDELLLGKENKSVDIVYEDDNILIVNKPSNIEVTGENSLSSFVKNYVLEKGGNFLEPCHRLDRNTTRYCFIC